MPPTISSKPILTCTLAAGFFAAAGPAVSMATLHGAPEALPATPTVATGCLRAAEAPGTYVLTATSIEPPVSDTIALEAAAEATPPQQTDPPPPIPGGERAPEPTRAAGQPEAPSASDDVVSLRLVFSRTVGAGRYVGQRVEVKGTLERRDHQWQGKGDARGNAGETGTRAGMAGSTETSGQTGSVSATGQTEQTARDAGTSNARDTEALILHVASVRMLSPRCEDGR